MSAAMRTWLAPREVLTQLGLTDADCDALFTAIADCAVQLALRHGCSPAEILIAAGAQLPMGERWNATRDELVRVVNGLQKGQG